MSRWTKQVATNGGLPGTMVELAGSDEDGNEDVREAGVGLSDVNEVNGDEDYIPNRLLSPASVTREAEGQAGLEKTGDGPDVRGTSLEWSARWTRA